MMNFLSFCRVMTLVAILGAAAAGQITLQSETIEPRLQKAMQEKPADELLRAYAVFGPRLDVPAHLPAARLMDRAERRRFAIDLAKNHASDIQVDGLTLLRNAEEQGLVEDIRILWINGVISFSATKAVIAELAALEEVIDLRLDQQIPARELVDAAKEMPKSATPVAVGDGSGGPVTPPHNLANGAQSVWNLGYRGRGVVVAICDTLFQYDHPDLVNRQWSNPGEIAGNGIDDDMNGFVDDVLGWDFINNDPFPYTTAIISNDILAHGTYVAGLVVGDGSSGLATGVAPEAQAMFLGASSTETNAWAAYQYALDNGADVISSSLTFKWTNEPDYSSFRQATDVELLAGVIHSNSSGNQGNQTSAYPVPFNIGAPGNCPPPWLAPAQVIRDGISAVMAVGATEAVASTTIATFSGIGPAAWTQANADATYFFGNYPSSFAPYNDYPWSTAFFGPRGLIKPDVCAPSGNGLVSTSSDYLNGAPAQFYDTFNGTSGSQPQLAGLLCLMLQVNPRLSPEELSRIVQETAQDLGPAGKDNSYGAGRISCIAAVNRVLANYGSLGPFDVLMVTEGLGLPAAVSVHRPGRPGLFVHPQPGDGVPFPLDFRNGSICHIENTSYAIVGQGVGPFGVYLLDFRTGLTTPTSTHLGNASSQVLGITYDSPSGNAYLVADTNIQVINGPISDSSFISSQPAAQPGILFTAGIDAEGSGSVFVGANQSTVFRFGVGATTATPVFSSAGITDIAVDRRTGDIYITRILNDQVDRHASDGTFIESLTGTLLDEPIAVDFDGASGGIIAVGRNESMTVSTSGEYENILFQQLSSGTILSSNIFGRYEHGNTGDDAAISCVTGTFFDPSFENQGLFDSTIRTPWVSAFGDANRRTLTTACLPALNPYDADGFYSLRVSAAGSDDAVAPGASGNLPSFVVTEIAFDPQRPVLSFTMAFLSAEGDNQATYNDFAGATIFTNSGQTIPLSSLDTFSTTGGTTDATCDPPSAPIKYSNVSVDLRNLLPGIAPGEAFRLQFHCGNAADDANDSALLVDNIELSSAGLHLRLETVGTGVLRFAYENAAPGALVITFVAVDQPAVPRGSGPILGIGLNALNILGASAPPFVTYSNSLGQYNQTFGGIPSGFVLEACAVEVQGAGPSQVSNIAGPLFIF